jgi:hypothetical protein
MMKLWRFENLRDLKKLFAVMISCLQKVNAIITHEINDTMLLG